MHLFYSPGLSDEREYTLSADESHHVVRVLRLTAGDEIILVNGRGGWYRARIHRTDPKACAVEITGHEEGYGKPDYHLHIAIAPTKQADRMEWFVEKATEIGIDEITPVICDRSERKELKPDRLLKIAVSAMKQSLKAFHPIIHDPMLFGDFIRAGREGTRCIAHCRNSDKVWLADIAGTERRITVLIGPEGDFTPAEIDLAVASHYSPVSLGNSRLRTETAGIVAAHAVSLIFR